MSKNEIENKNLHKHNVHRVLAHSYSMYFILFLIGVTLDFIFKFKIFISPILVLVGIILIILASFLILWAQKTSRNLKKENMSKETFGQGPYYYTRSPTHWGLFFLMLGFGIIANAFFVVLFTIIAFITTKFLFLDKQEKILEAKYGSHYKEYKKLVKF